MKIICLILVSISFQTVASACRNPVSSNPGVASAPLSKDSLHLTSATKPCPDQGGPRLYFQGSGSCVGNNLISIPVSTANVTLIYNSLKPENTQCLSTGWSVEQERYLAPSGSTMYLITDGHGRTFEYPVVPGQTVLNSKNPLLTRNRLLPNLKPYPKELTPQGMTFTYSSVITSGVKKLRRFEDRFARGVTFKRNTAGCLTSIVSDSGQKTTFSYVSGRIASIVDNASSTYNLSYGSDGNLTQVTGPDGFSWKLAYRPSSSFLISTTSSVGEKNSYEYISNTGVLKSATNPSNWRVSFEYTGTTVTTHSGTSKLVETFDSFGHLVKTSRDGAQAKMTWDSLQRVSAITDSLGRKKTFSYAGPITSSRANWMPSSMTNEDGSVTSFTYDTNLNTKTVTTTSNGNTVVKDQTWDQLSQLLTTTINSNVYQFIRANGNLTAIVDPNGRTIYRATYDSTGHQLSTTDRFGRVSQLQWANDRVSKQTDYLGRTIQYTYSGIGNLEKIASPDGLVSSKTYNTSGMQTSASTSLASNTSINLKSALSLTRQSDGQPTLMSQVTSANGISAFTETISYQPGARMFKSIKRTVKGPGSSPTIVTDDLISDVFSRVVFSSPLPPVIPR